MPQVKEYFHDVDLKANQLFNSRLHNITTADRIILGGGLSTSDKGYQVYDVDLLTPFFWDGGQWNPAGGGTSSIVWGSITGVVTDQTDLTTYLAANYYPLSSNPAGYLTSIPTLQEVTDAGFTTNNNIEFISGGNLVMNAGLISFSADLTNTGLLGSEVLTGLRNWLLPDASGTIALTSDLSSYLTQTAADLLYYPLSSNPANYITSSDLSSYLTTATAATTYVPYTGATGNVNLGGNDIYASNFAIQPTGYGLLAALTRNLAGSGYGILNLRNGSNGFIQPTALSQDRTYTLPNASGTIALTSDIPSLTPAALTKVDDTNVTITLGGSPSTALLAATSLTLGWTGTLADSRIASASTWNAKEPAITAGTTSQYWRGDKTWQTFPTIPAAQIQSDWNQTNNTLLDYIKNKPTIPTVGTWGALNYPTWTSGTPFVKMTAAGTFALDTNAYLTGITSSDVTTALGYTPVTNARTLTINGTTYDLTADRSWSVGTVTSVGATGPITSSGGNTPTISTSIATNKLIGRSSAGVGVMEEITVGSGLTLSGGTLTNTATPTPLGYYGAWQDMLTQTAAVSNVGYPFIFRTIDLENQVRVVTNGTDLTRITFDNTGIYNLQFSAQIQNTDNAQHDVTIWLRKNGTDVTGSAGFISVPARKSAGAGNEGHGVYGWNYLLSVVAGEYYEIVWSTSDATHITIQYYAAGSPPPSTASVLATVTQQSGIMAGTGITAINSLTGSVQTLATGTTGTDFAVSSSGTTHTLNLPDASATNRGALTSANWTTFNNKQDDSAWVNASSQAVSGYTGTPTKNIQYKLLGNKTAILQWEITGTGSGGGATLTLPFTSSAFGTQYAMYQANQATTAIGICQVTASSTTLTFYPNATIGSAFSAGQTRNLRGQMIINIV